jgi:hypothetical protein
MRLFTWLRKRRIGRPQTKWAPARQPAPRFQPLLEALEDRWLPSRLASTTDLTSSLNPSSLGQSVTFTAAVTGSEGTPTELVQFKIDGKVEATEAVGSTCLPC